MSVADSWNKGIWNNVAVIADCSGGGTELEGYLTVEFIGTRATEMGTECNC